MSQHICGRCDAEFSVEEGLDPTEFCHDCAHAMVYELAACTAERDRAIAELRADNVKLNNLVHSLGQSGAPAMGRFRQRAEAAEAKLDAVMLEYCPDEMTEEQRERWAANQVPAQGAPKIEPTAYLHHVVQNDGDADFALSFSPDSFPLEGVGGFKSIRHEPLYLHTSNSAYARAIAEWRANPLASTVDGDSAAAWIEHRAAEINSTKEQP